MEGDLIKTRNKRLVGAGYQFRKTRTSRVRVENEEGEFLFYANSIYEAEERILHGRPKDAPTDLCEW
jgi:hypothetical protein